MTVIQSPDMNLSIGKSDKPGLVIRLSIFNAIMKMSIHVSLDEALRIQEDLGNLITEVMKDETT